MYSVSPLRCVRSHFSEEGQGRGGRAGATADSRVHSVREVEWTDTLGSKSTTDYPNVGRASPHPLPSSGESSHRRRHLSLPHFPRFRTDADATVTRARPNGTLSLGYAGGNRPNLHHLWSWIGLTDRGNSSTTQLCFLPTRLNPAPLSLSHFRNDCGCDELILATRKKRRGRW